MKDHINKFDEEMKKHLIHEQKKLLSDLGETLYGIEQQMTFSKDFRDLIKKLDFLKKSPIEVAARLSCLEGVCEIREEEDKEKEKNMSFEEKLHKAKLELMLENWNKR